MFLTPLEDFDYKPVVKDDHIVKNRVVLQSDLKWESRSGALIVVKKGFEFDLASVPWWLGFIAEKLGRHQRAAALHDCLYYYNVRSRVWSDQQFLEAMEYDKVGWLRRRVLWRGVRKGGAFSWRKHSFRIEREARDK